MTRGETLASKAKTAAAPGGCCKQQHGMEHGPLSDASALVGLTNMPLGESPQFLAEMEQFFANHRKETLKRMPAAQQAAFDVLLPSIPDKAFKGELRNT